MDAEGPVLEGRSYVIASRARLVERVDSWQQDAAVAFAKACAQATRALALDALRRQGRDDDAEELRRAETMTELGRTAAAVLQRTAGAEADLLGYTADVGRLAAAVAEEPASASRAATVALVSATAAAHASDLVNTWAGERARQGAWLADRVLTTS